MRKVISYGILIICGILFSCKGGQFCKGNEQGMKDFGINKFCGEWYEVGRIEKDFEKGTIMNKVVILAKKGGEIEVVNSAYDYVNKAKKEYKGEGKLVEKDKWVVSFSEIGKEIRCDVVEEVGDRYVLLYGNEGEYVWIFSREKEMPRDVRERFEEKIRKDLGKKDNFMWVKHYTIGDIRS